MRASTWLLTAALLAIGTQVLALDDDNPSAKVKEIAESYVKVWSAGQKAIAQASSDEDRSKARKELAEQLQDTAAKLFDIAKKNSKEAAAAEAITFLIAAGSNTPDSEKVVESALEFVSKHLLESEKMSGVCQSLGKAKPSEAAEKCLRDLSELNPSNEVKGHATFALAQQLVRKAEHAYRKDRKSHVQINEQAEKLFERVGEKFAEVSGGRNSKLGDLAKYEIKVLRKLSVGKEAPEMDGESVEGDKMKLSDFRGKVVVVDFWGTWCPPCRALLPHVKELVAKQKDKPFVFVGVNSDKDAKKVQEFLSNGDYEWKNFFDGGSTGGPIATEYLVQSWPTIYVLDHKGVIRYKNVRGKDMDDAVEQLLDELAKEKDKTSSK